MVRTLERKIKALILIAIIAGVGVPTVLTLGTSKSQQGIIDKLLLILAMRSTEETIKMWTWVSGSNLTSQVGTYGTQGVPAAGNVPGKRER